MPVDDTDEAVAAPELTEKQREEAEERSPISIDVVHEAVRKDGDEELNRSVSALAWSGLAAGLSMGFSFVAQALIYSHLPDSVWRTLLVRLGYPIGFLIVIIGRQQLFTENTVLAIIPLLARRNMPTFVLVLRLWAVVFLPIWWARIFLPGWLAHTYVSTDGATCHAGARAEGHAGQLRRGSYCAASSPAG